MPHEMQTVLADGDEVAGPVRAVPSELRDGREGLRIVDEVEVVGEPNTADHKFAGPPRLDGVPHFVNDGCFPTGQRLPHQRQGSLRGYFGCRRDPGCFSAVRIPHFAPGHDARDVSRAGLAAQDEEA